MEGGKDPQKLKNDGSELFKQKKYQEALDCFTELLSFTSNQEQKAILFKNQGACYIQLKKFVDAATAYTNCLEIQPDDPKALQKRCLTFEHMERYDDAYRDAVKLIQMNPEDIQAQALINRLDPIVNGQKEDGSSSEETLDLSLSHSPPKDCSTLKKEGRKLFAEEKFKEALKCYKEGVKLNSIATSDKATFYKNQAACYIRLEQYPEAVAASTKCLEMLPGDIKAFYRRCQAYEKMGQYQNAYKDAKAFQKGDPKNEAIKPILQRLESIMHSLERAPVSTDKTVKVYDREDHTQEVHGVERLKKFCVDADTLLKKGQSQILALNLLESAVRYGQQMLRNKTPDEGVVRTMLSNIHKLMATIQFKRGDFFESFNQFEKALQSCFYERLDLFSEYLTKFLPMIVDVLLQKEMIQEIKSIFKRQIDARNSDVFEVWTCGYRTAVTCAEALRKHGEPGFDNHFLKNIHLDEAMKILNCGVEWFYFNAAQSCEKAVEYSNGRDFEVLRTSALVFNQIGDTRKALQYCDEALALQSSLDLINLHIELLEELSDLSDTQSVADSVASEVSDQPDEEWLTGTNIRQNQMQNERARSYEAHSKTKRKGSSRRRPNRQRREESRQREKEAVENKQNKSAENAQPQNGMTTQNAVGQMNRVIKPNEVKPQQRRKPKMTSKKIFYYVIEEYEVQLACDECWIKESDIPDCQYLDIVHTCKRNKLLLRNRTGGNSWEFIRQNPLNFAGSNDLCEEKEAGNPCSKRSKCKFPHSNSEKSVWNWCFQHKWNVEALIIDLRDTNLRLIAILSDIPDVVDFFLGCKKCVQDRNYDQCKKANAHTPKCNDNHDWNKSSAVAMIKVNNERMKPLKNVTDIVSLFDDVDMEQSKEKVARLVADLSELVKKEFKPAELVQQNDILRKQKKEKAKHPMPHPSIRRLREGRQNSRLRLSSSSSHASIDDEYEEPKFDTYFDDVMTNEDIDEYKESVTGDGMEDYYKNESAEQLKAWLEEEPETYKKCTISISQTQKAKCYPIDDNSIDSIEIRGRMNCGKSFDGDIVVVELMDVKMLDSDQKVKRGRVVGVLLEKTNRTAYNFVCTVDPHFSHLMVPICGKAPKIHVENKEIKDRDDKVKNRLVCIYEESGGKIEYVRKVKINPKDRHNQLFLVKYNKWDDEFMYPYGYVAKVIEPGKNVETGQRILDLMYQVPQKYDQRMQQYLKIRFCDDIFPDNAKRRIDFTMEHVISIDPPDCMDVDDALSVSSIPGPSGDSENLIKVGIHIADVTNFIEKDDDIDTEAAKRRISFYSADRSKKEGGQHMLPEILGTNVCSLLEGKERYALSLFLVMNANGEVQNEPEFVQTKIINKKKMTYSEAQLMIDDGMCTEDDQQTRQTVLTLHRLGQQLKRQRLQNAVFHKEIDDIGQENDNATEAHELVAEFMILANSYTAEFLVGKYGEKAPVRKQRSPPIKNLTQWKEKYENTIPGSFNFDRYCEKEYVVAFDSGCCQEVHEAFSVSMVPSTTNPTRSVYKVGIHVADIPIIRVKNRRNDPLIPRGCGRQYLLQDIYCQHIDGFIEAGESHSLSVYVTIRDDGTVEGLPQFKQTNTKYQIKLSHIEAQSLLDSKSVTDNEDARQTLHMLFSIAQKLQEKRSIENEDHKEKETIAAIYGEAEDIGTLVKEFLILSNKYAGEFVYMKHLQDKPPKKENVETINYQEEFLVSIDPPRCTDIYDAFSVRMETSPDKSAKPLYKVGIHIFDVIILRNRDNELDIDAAKRRFKVYSAYKMEQMGGLHIVQEKDQVSKDIRKLEQFLLSLFIYIDENGITHGQPQFRYTKLSKQRKMSIKQAQVLINSPNLNGDKLASQTLVTLHRVAQKLKQNRLKDKLSFGDFDHKPDVHTLVEEFILLADKQCGQKASQDSFYVLRTTFDEMNVKIRNQHTESIMRAITTENIHPSYAVANNDWLNMQHPAEVTLYEEDESYHFSLQKNTYTWFTSPIRRYIDIVVHRMIIAAIEHKDRCQCPYTKEELEELCEKFNSTVKRQRQHDRAGKVLVAAQFLQSNPAYFPSVVTSFDSDEGIEFDWPFLPHLKKDQRNLRLSCFSVCDKPEITDSFMKIYWQRRIYDILTTKVDYARTKHQASSDTSLSINHRRHITGVDRWLWNRLIEAVCEEESDEDVLRIMLTLLNDAKLKNQYKELHDDVTTEMKYPHKIVNHHVKFNMAIEGSSVVQLQLGSIYKKGLIQPQINLYSVTPSLDICMEHMRDPINAFSEVATLSHKQSYTSVHDYKETWLPMLSMEAACNAAQEGDPIIINNVGVEMRKTKQSFSGVFEIPLAFCQHRQINFFANNKDKNESELEERDEAQDYICLRIKQAESSAQVFPAERSDIREHVKWRNVWSAHCIVNPMKSIVTKEKNVRVHIDVHQYCAEPPENILNPVEENKKIPATIELLTKTLPDRRMEMAVNRLEEATEFCKTIVLGKPFREEEQLLDVKTIPDSLDILVNVPEDKPPLPNNNSTQIRAIKTALSQRFTLIQGPPGTGKTLTGVKLVYWFSKMNESHRAPKRQVMYCGPSNSAVDVAARQMISRLYDKCPKIIRVYSELLENQVYPLPRDAMVINSRNRRYAMGGKADLDEISLHHRIRKESNSFARKILTFDRKFKFTKPEDISDEQVLEYQKLVTDASVHELKQHEVILCTASVSASPRILRATNIYQCVIDECGMCMEAETLVPLVSHKPAQVVLIGDHKQLRPIVVNNAARELGLEISMFERQALLIKAREGRSVQSRARSRQMTVAETRERHGLENNETLREEKSAGLIMLDVQYRMHSEICAFPSRHFYENKLETVLTSWWSSPTDNYNMWDLKRIWPNSNAPIVFCHLEGAEQTLTVSTDEGSEQSKSNRLEMDEVVRIYRDFRYKYNVRAKNITVLSQYKAQCKQIEKELIEEEQGKGKPNVSTVVASQGDEWDYVILSTVRSLPRYEIDKKPTIGWLKRNLGFITDHHQINVALTRARRGLVIIGNKHLLKCDGGKTGLWDKLLDYYESKGAVVDAHKFPRVEGEVLERKNIFQDRNWGSKIAPRFSKEMQRQYKSQNS